MTRYSERKENILKDFTICDRIRPYLLRGPEESPLYAAMAGLPIPAPAVATKKQTPAKAWPPAFERQTTVPSTAWPLAFGGFFQMPQEGTDVVPQLQAQGE